MYNLVINKSSQNQIAAYTKDLPHALIISGQSGLGLGSIATQIAKDNGTLLETVYPKKRQPNGNYEVDTENGTIIIEDIRQLYVRTKSKFTSPQIVVIDFAGRTMSPGAQNAFLKLLEEPQQKIHFILAAQTSSQLLPTVTSRCQRIDIKPITLEQTNELLDTLEVTDTTRRSRIIFIAAGLPAEITRLATSDTYYEARVVTVQDARTILGGDSYTRLKTIQSYKDKRPLTLQLIDDMINQLQLSVAKSPDVALLSQLDTLVDTYAKIKANGNIALNLSKVLL